MLILKLILITAILAMAIPALKAQITYEPSPPYDNSPDVVIYFHADAGNKGPLNQREYAAS